TRGERPLTRLRFREATLSHKGRGKALSLPRACHPPDRAVAILRHQQGSVLRHGYAHRPPPHLRVTHHKPRDEILVLAGRLAVLHPDTDHLVAGALRAVPGAVLGGEGVALVFGWKLRALIEGHAERGRVRLYQHV